MHNHYPYHASKNRKACLILKIFLETILFDMSLITAFFQIFLQFLAISNGNL